MIRSFVVFFILIPLVTFAQKSSEMVILPGEEYAAGTRVQNAYRGVSFIIPRDWRGAMPPDQRIFLMTSEQKAGVGLAIFQSSVSESDIIQYLKQSQNLGDNIILKPVGKPKINRSEITMEYTSMTSTGHALAKSGPFQNTIVFLFAGPVEDREYFLKVLQKMNTSVKFSKPDPGKLISAWTRALSGQMLKKVSVDDSQGIFPTVLHLCPEGKAQATLPEDPTNIGNQPTLVDGNWNVIADGAQSYLQFTPSRGKVVRASLDVFGNYVILQGGKYHLTRSDVCK